MDAALDGPVRTTTRGRGILMQEETLVPQVRVHAPMNCQYIACARAQSHDLGIERGSCCSQRRWL